MAIGALVKSFGHVLLSIVITAQAAYAAVIGTETQPPGVYHTSWIGNSFGGYGATERERIAFASNGFGYWIQDSIGAMAVSPDGTVFLGAGWDEGGRGIGLYRNGLPNRVIVQATGSPAKAFDFNTANEAICVDKTFFYVGNTGKGLLRFQWTPDDTNSARYLDGVVLPERAVSLSCSNGKILVGYPDKIELRDENNMKLDASYPASDVSSVLLAPDGSFWMIADGGVHKVQADGKNTALTLSGIDKPTSLAWDRNGMLIVGDNGPAQQVLFFDITGQPKLVSSFGVRGGLYSGTPGANAPEKLFGLRGAGMDAEGNLYIGMSFDGSPSGNTFIRAFSPSGQLLWEDYATAFVDTFGFEPDSDGAVVYGRTTRWQLDLDSQRPGSEAKLVAITLDPLQYPSDPRIKHGYSVYPRLIGGTQLLYALGQRGGGFLIFAGAPGTDILHQVASIDAPNSGWAWYVTADGDIWNGDASGHQIALYPLKSITSGQPVYDWQQPTVWPWPSDFEKVTRVIYNKAADSLYIFGYLKGQQVNGAWGTVGFTARRYDHWLAGHPTLRWTNASLPVSPGAFKLGKPLPAKDVSLAGDYLFLGMVRDARDNAAKVNIVDTATGQYVGTLKAGSEIGGLGGWEDMVGSVQATERADGEYLVLVEEDSRAKNILFRWKP